MALSAAFTVEGNANPAAHHVAYGSTIDLVLTSTDGATSIVWSIMGCSEPSEPIPTITTTGSPNGKIASFVFPADSADTLGRTFLVRCTVSNQIRGVDGVYEQDIEYAVIGAENSQGELPIVPGEKNYRHGTHGWSPEINRALNNSGGGGGGGGGWTDDGSVVRLTNSSDSVAIGTATLSGTEKLRVIGSSRFEQSVATAGNPKAFYVSGAAHTTLSSGAEVIDVDFALDRTVQHSTGAVTSQRAFVVRAPTYGFVGASVVTDAATLAITAAPVAGTNATLTNSYALWVQAGAVRFANLTAGVVVSSSTGVLSSVTGTALQVLRWNSGGTALEFANPGSSLSAPSDPGDDGKVAVAATGNLTYTLLSNAHIASGAAISLSKLATIATDRLLGRDTAGTGAIEELTVGGGVEFTTSGGIQRSALTGDVTASAGSNTTAIAAGVIVDADVNASAAIAFSKLATIATDSLLGRDTAGTGALETIGLNATLSMTGAGALQRAALTGDVTAAAGSNTTAIAVGVIVDADINASAGIAITKLGTIATDSLMGRDTAGTGAIEAISVTGGLEFTGSTSIQRSAISGDITIAAGSGTAAITAGAIIDADVNAAAAIAHTKLATLAGLSVLGRDVNTTGAIGPITGTDGQVLRISGTTLDFGTIDIGSITGDVPISQLADITALSVLANATNATAATTAVASSVDGQVFLRSGTTLTWSTIATAGITNSAVTYAKIQNVSATDRLLGRDTVGAGVIEELTVGGGVEFTGSGGIQRSALTGDVTASAGSNTTAIAAGVIVNADINASAAIALSKLAAGSDAGNMLYWNGSAWVETTTFETEGTSISFGADPAGGGAVRLSPDDSIGIRLSNGNTIPVLGQSLSTVVFGSSDAALTSVQFAVGTGGQFSLAVAGSGEYVFNATTFDGQGNTLTAWASGAFSSHLALGATPALTGAIRLTSTSTIVLRESAADRVVASWDVTYGTVFGSSSALAAVSGSSQVNLFVGGLGGVTALTVTTGSISTNNIPILAFGTGASAPILRQNATTGATGALLTFNAQDSSAIGGTGGALKIRAGDATGASGTRTGGELELSSGTGTTLPGALTLRVGSTTMLQAKDLGSGREVLSLLGTVTTTEMPSSTGDKVVYIAPRTTAPTVAPSTGLVMYANADGELTTVSADPGVTGIFNMLLGDGSNAVILKAGGATSDYVELVTGAGSSRTRFTNGYVNFDNSNAAAGSTVDLRYRGNTYFTMDRTGGQRISFFGAATAAQAADPVALTHTPGSAADNTVADVGAAYNQTTLNQNFADLVAKYNTLRTILRGYGLAA